MATAAGSLSVSVVIPTFQREQELTNTLDAVVRLLCDGDEIIVVDQTPTHEANTEECLRGLAATGRVRWYRRDRASQCEAMNIAAILAKGDILIFLDDDIIPGGRLLSGHREALSSDNAPPATCGQVLQPWDEAPVDSVAEFDLGFNAAYGTSCEIRSLMAGNFAMQKATYFAVGGMDENFVGSNYRNDAEMAYRICHRTGRRIGFVPSASLRHLLAGGGNRAFGAKDTWGHIGGSIGDYYFAFKWLAPGAALRHSVLRICRASVNRNTVKHPWLIPSMLLRELVAIWRAFCRDRSREKNFVQPLRHYGPVRDGLTGELLVDSI